MPEINCLNNYQQVEINKLVPKIKAQGFRVFIAKRGTYGIYTDAEGTRVISFQFFLGLIDFSGNYKTDNPKQCGTGWQLPSGTYKKMFNACPPSWAVREAKWSYSTLAEHLETYGNSSRYEEV